MDKKLMTEYFEAPFNDTTQFLRKAARAPVPQFRVEEDKDTLKTLGNNKTLDVDEVPAELLKIR